jgi:hypothetical protein
VDSAEAGSLDGIRTPAGCTGPTLVVWRERLNWVDRTRFVLVGAVILGAIVFAFGRYVVRDEADPPSRANHLAR